MCLLKFNAYILNALLTSLFVLPPALARHPHLLGLRSAGQLGEGVPRLAACGMFMGRGRKWNNFGSHFHAIYLYIYI
jgi:hypothetical protein